MMKKIIYLLVFAFLLFIPGMESKAFPYVYDNSYWHVGDATNYFVVPEKMFDNEILNSEITKDEKGRIKSGYFFLKSSSRNKMHLYDNNIYNSENGYMYITAEKKINESYNSKLYQWKLTLWCNSDVKFLHSNVNFPFSEEINKYNVAFDEVKDAPVSEGKLGLSSVYTFVNSVISDEDRKDIPTYQVNFFCTNIPIFDEENTEAIEKYKQTGDYSGAENSDALDYNSMEFDEFVEMPQGLKLVGGFADGYTKQTPYGIEEDIILEWTQGVDTTSYKYTVDMKMTIEMLSQNIKGGKPTGEKYTTEWIPFKSVPYKGSTSITSKFRASEVEGLLFPAIGEVYKNATGKSGLPYKGYYINQIVVRVRNISGNKCSNYVVIKIDRDGSTVTATVENQEEEVVPDEQYNGDSVLDKPEDNSNVDLSNFSDILVFIKNGFGLLGSNGLIAMFTSFFSFLPEQWWTLILLGLGLIILIGVINFLLKR